MKYDVAQTIIEQFMTAGWNAFSDKTAIQYDNVAFNSDLYTEFARCTVIFGEGQSRAVTAGFYRQNGILMWSVFTKPAAGINRLNMLAARAADMTKSARARPQAPATDPVVKFKVPSLHRDLNEKLGWVMAQVSCPFYYDI